MPETGKGLGVRSLMAKFENSNQSTSTSLPPTPTRGRSPVGSDAPGATRPISKVRAGLIAVEKAANSASSATAPDEEPKNHSAQGEKTAPSRNTQSGSSIGEAANTSHDGGSETKPSPKEESTKENLPPKPDGTIPETNGKSTPNTTSPSASYGTSHKRASDSNTAGKHTSNADATKQQQVPKSTPSARSKAQSESHSPPSNKPSTTSPHISVKTVRPSKSTAEIRSGKDVPKSQPHIPRGTPSTRSSTTHADSGKSNTSKTHSSPTDSGKLHPKSPTQPLRRPATPRAPDRQSTARTITKSPAPSNVPQKPSSNSKPTEKQSHSRLTAPTNSSIRKKASNTSLADNASKENHDSRTENTSPKAVSESFLARLTRPTASSAGKVHEKVEVKSSPPRLAKTTRTPPKKVAGNIHTSPRIAERGERRQNSSHAENPSSLTGSHPKAKSHTKTEPSSPKTEQSHSELLQHGSSSLVEVPKSSVEKVEEADSDSAKTAAKNAAEDPSSEDKATQFTSGIVEPSESKPIEVTGENASRPDTGNTAPSHEKAIASADQSTGEPAQKTAKPSTDERVQTSPQKPLESSTQGTQDAEKSADTIIQGTPSETPNEKSSIERSETDAQEAESFSQEVPANSTAQPVEQKQQSTEEPTAVPETPSTLDSVTQSTEKAPTPAENINGTSVTSTHEEHTSDQAEPASKDTAEGTSGVVESPERN